MAKEKKMKFSMAPPGKNAGKLNMKPRVTP